MEKRLFSPEDIILYKSGIIQKWITTKQHEGEAYIGPKASVIAHWKQVLLILKIFQVVVKAGSTTAEVDQYQLVLKIVIVLNHSEKKERERKGAMLNESFIVWDRVLDSIL